MGLLKKIFKPISKVLDKIIPNEIKPALPYLDVITKIKEKFNIPIFAYQVSGEFSMLKFSGEKKIIDYEKCLYESLIAIKRSGASAIFCYGAIDIAKNLKNE